MKLLQPLRRAKRRLGRYLRDREMDRAFRSGASPAPWQFVMFAGIGDQMLWLSLLPEFRRRADREVEVYCQDRSSTLAGMYAGRAFDRLIKIPDLSDRAMRLLKSRNELLPGRAQLAWHDCYAEDDLKYLFGKDQSNGDLVRELLMLPADAPMHAPACTDADRRAAIEHMHRLNLPIGNTVLLAPWARSLFNLPMPWWEALVRVLLAHGFMVATNIGNRGRSLDPRGEGQTLETLPGTVAVDIPLTQAIPFAELCGYFIGIRSGLCDLLAFANVRSLVVCCYPRKFEAFNRKVHDIWSVRRMYGRSDIVEHFQALEEPFDATWLTQWVSDMRAPAS
jgi:hypothetical protein